MFRKFRRRAGSQTMIGIWIAILTLVLFSGDLRARYVDAIERAKATARNFAGVLAEDTALTFDMVTRTLREAEVIRQQMVLGKIGLEEANAALRSLRTSSPVIVAIGWSNPQGDIIAHSYDRPIPRPNISSMEHFVEQRDNPRDSVYIATPFRSAVGDKWFTAASLRLNNLDGSFAGALTAPIDQTYFSSLYRSMDLGSDGSILLLHRKGPLLAREPQLPGAIGKSFAHGPLLSEYLPRADAGAYETVSVVDGVPRIAGYKAVRGLPLVVLVSYARSDVLATWYRHLTVFGPLVLSFVAGILYFNHRLVRKTRELQATSRKLAEINRRFDIAMSNMPNGLCMFDAERKISIANDRFRLMYNLTMEQVKPGTPLRSLLETHQANGESSELGVDGFIQAVLNQPTQTQLLQDGRTVFIRRRPIPEGGWIATHEDISELKRIEETLKAKATELEQTNARFYAAINNMPHGVCLYDADQQIVVSNKSYAEIYALSQAHVQPGTSLRQVLENRRQSGTHFKVAPDTYIDVNVKKANETQELADGRIVAISRHQMPGGGWLTTHEDITERSLSERKISFLAKHDLLTGLPNRGLFTEMLDHAAAEAAKGTAPFAVFMLDLDKFKAVNDTLGHPAGDQLLVEVAQRLRSSVREGDIAARLGGDEFALLQPIGQGTREDSIALALRIIDVIAEPFNLDGQQVNVGTSIGIAFSPDDGLTPDDLMKKADLALYSTKANGRNDFRVFRPDMIAAAQTQKTVEAELRDALANNEFELFYQPIFDTQTQRVCGAEALVRWHHPRRGLVQPDQFIEAAEATGLIVPLGEWILQQACRDAATWPSYLRVSVNLSAVQFNKGNLFDVVLCALVETGLSPERLDLEMTESAVLDNQPGHLETVRHLKNLGITIALDDFGTGYSSNSYLINFPFDKIKIDKSFTQGIGRRRDCDAVVASILALARGLGIAVTAEGIESEDQFQRLKNAGVNFAQGFHLGEPVPVLQFFAEYLRLTIPDDRSALRRVN